MPDAPAEHVILILKSALHGECRPFVAQAVAEEWSSQMVAAEPWFADLRRHRRFESGRYPNTRVISALIRPG